MRYPIKDKFWGWRMEVFAYWDSWRTSPTWHQHQRQPPTERVWRRL